MGDIGIEFLVSVRSYLYWVGYGVLGGVLIELFRELS